MLREKSRMKTVLCGVTLTTLNSGVVSCCKSSTGGLASDEKKEASLTDQFLLEIIVSYLWMYTTTMHPFVFYTFIYSFLNKYTVLAIVKVRVTSHHFPDTHSVAVIVLPVRSIPIMKRVWISSIIVAELGDLKKYTSTCTVTHIEVI